MICPELSSTSPGSTRMTAFANGLSRRGYTPVVLAPYRNRGEVIPCWRQVDNLEKTGDISASVLGGRGRTQTLRQKLLNLWVPMEPTITLSLLRLKWDFTKAANRAGADLIFTTSNPLAYAVGGVLLKRKYRLPLIVELRDPWTQDPLRKGPTWIHFVVESLLERWVLRAADAVIMNTPTARANLLTKYSWLHASKVHVLSHGFDGEMLSRSLETFRMGTARVRGGDAAPAIQRR